MGLTTAQESVFTFICNYLEESGYPPSYSEMAGALNFSSDGTIRSHLAILERKGYIKRNGSARGITILRPPTPKHIPIIGSIAAGPLTPSIEDFQGTLDDVNELKAAPNRFALMVSGDSMINAGIMDGDIAIIQRDSPIHNGQIAAVMVDNDATLKRIYFEQDQIRLQPENELYNPMYIHRQDGESRFIGRYIALVRQAA
ncbi:repressor LexA [bacterium]|nr:repressor LexA [bacterium]